MYEVKLANKGNDIIVDGIKITRHWTIIEKKTDALKELEKKKIIKIRKMEPGYDKGTLNYLKNLGNVICYDIEPSSIFSNEREYNNLLNSPKFMDTMTLINSPSFQQTMTLINSPEYKNTMALWNSPEYKTLTMQAKEWMDSSLTGQVKAWMDSSLARQANALMTISLSGQIEDLRASLIVGQADYMNLTLIDQAKFLMNLVVPGMELSSSTCIFLEKSFNAQPFTMDLKTAILESVQQYYKEYMESDSFKYIDIAINSLPTGRALEFTLEMSHNSMFEALEALEQPIEEIQLALEGLSTPAEAVKMALEKYKSTNLELKHELEDFPPLIEVEEEIEQIPPPTEEEEDLIEFSTEEDEEFPLLLAAIKKELIESVKPPTTMGIIHDCLKSNQKVEDEILLDTVLNYEKKQKKWIKLLGFFKFFREAYNIETVATIKENIIAGNSISQRIPWIGSKIELKRFYNALRKEQLIQNDIEYSQFEKHFSKDSLSQILKIRWLGIQTNLLYLFDLLIRDSLLSRETKDERWKLISDHFEKKDGSPFSNTQCARAYYNMVSTNKNKTPKKSKKMEKIVKFVKASGNPAVLPGVKPDGLQPSTIPRFH